MSYRRARSRLESLSAVESVESLEARRMLAGTPAKIGGVLSYLASDFATRPEAKLSRSVIRNKTYVLAGAQPNRNLIRTVGDDILIKAVAATKNTTSLAKQFASLGASVASSYGPVLTVAVPVSKLSKVNGLSGLLYAGPSYGAYTKAGKTDDLGVQSMNADTAARQYGVDGSGVRVGILSDSYNVTSDATTAAQDVASGDLPTGGVTVVKEDTISGDGADEGRAMAQIVHDVAPGAAISFYTADDSESDFANGILTLAKPTSQGGQGAQVVVDDVGYYDEPFFQDGIVAQAVNAAYSSFGTSYFSAAGNEARQSYEGNFGALTTTSGPSVSYKDATQNKTVSLKSGTFETFGTASNIYQAITIPAGGEFTISYQWDSPFASASINAGNTAASGKTQNRVGVYLLNSAKSSVVAYSTDNTINGDAVQVLDYSNTGTSAKTVYLVANVISGTAPGYIKYVDLAGGNTIQYATNSGTSYGHPVAAGAMGVGAAYYANTPAFGNTATKESFSSSGGTGILFNADGTRKATAEYRNQPAIVAPDGAATTFFYDQYGNTTGETPGTDSPADGQYHFFGTSAAAPHAAAVAALMLQAKPSLTNAQIYSILESTAADMGAAGYDYDTGYGLLQADKALVAVSASSISGRAYDDNNASGTYDAGDTAVAGQTVFLDDNNNGVADSSTSTFSNSTATAIPDATTNTGAASTSYGGLSRVTSSIMSTATGRVTSVSVTLDVSHARFSDLGLTLITPSGVRIPLLTTLGGVSSGKGTGATITLSDAGSSSIESTSSTGTLTGTYKPQTALAAAINESAAGTWQLEARDYRTGTTGTLNGWSITLGSADPTATTDANGNYTFAGLSPSSFYGTYHVRTVGAISGYALSNSAGYDLTLARSTASAGDDFAYVPNTPSTISSVVLDDGTAQRSRVRSITVTINGTVPAANIAAGAFTLTQTSGTGGPYTVNVASVTSSGSLTTIVLGFGGGALEGGSLLDGRYTLSIDGSKITDNRGLALDAAGTGTAGSTRTTSFFRLGTDVTGDGRITIADFNILAAAFNTSLGQSAFVDAMDVNGDGKITIADFNELAAKFNTAI